MKNTIFIIVFVFYFFSTTYSQQLPQFTQYMYNPISINPAYAGSREVLVITMLNRNQWTNVEGAPITQTISAHSSVPNTKMGLGLSFINDKLGYERTTYLYLDASYTIELSRDYRLAFGLKAGASKYDLDDALFSDPQNSIDPFIESLNFKWAPNFGLGFYFRSDSYYLSVSAPKLVNYRSRRNIEYIPIERVSYYFNGGYVYEVNHNIKIKPTFLVKYTNGSPISLDLTASTLVYEKLWLGGAYRLGDSFSALANFKVAKGISIGYSYDFIVSDLSPYTFGSHEFVLNLEFNFPEPSCKCPHLYN